jgi:hypothetical protein
VDGDGCELVAMVGEGLFLVFDSIYPLQKEQSGITGTESERVHHLGKFFNEKLSILAIVLSDISQMMLVEKWNLVDRG